MIQFPRTSIWIAIAALMLFFQACTDHESGTPLEPDSDAASISAGPSFQVSPGVFVTPPQAERILATVGQRLARTLGQRSDLREHLRTSMAASPFREGKLEFRAELNDPSSGLLSGMAEVSGEDGSAISRSLDSVPPLELYIPVDAHRAAWAGSRDLLVATVLSDDPGSRIHAYDLDGQSVALSFEEPPTQPTLVLIPAETDFDSDPTQVEAYRGGMIASSSGGIAMSSSSYSGGDGVYMTRLSLDDVHEPWTSGDPEIAVHLGVLNEANDKIEWKSCAGDNFSSSNAYYFDQNSQEWYGEVKVAAENTVKGKSVEYYIWEDDYERCDGTNHLEPHTNASLLNDLENVSTAFYAFYSLDSYSLEWKVITAAAALAKSAYDYLTALNEDDFVGIVKRISADCYTVESGPVWHALVDRNGNNTGGYTKLDNTPDVDREMCDPGSYDPVSVYIDGPTQIPTSASEGCGYQAIVSGGAGHNTYEWKWDGSVVGTYDFWVPSGGLSEGWHSLTVDVVDEYTGTFDSASLYVDVDDSYSCFSF